MAQDQTIPLAVSVVGFILLIVGSMGYMRIIGMIEALCYVMMAVGILTVIGAMAYMMYFANGPEGREEE